MRRPGAGGYRRQLVCPPRDTLQSLAASCQSAPHIATQLGVSPGTVRRWFTENDLPPLPASRKNRPWDRPIAELDDPQLGVGSRLFRVGRGRCVVSSGIRVGG